LKKVLRQFKIKPQEALYVGDMVYDIKAGKNARVKPIAILGGSCSRKELARHKPYKVITKLPELTKIVK
jgi:phosphoglycolate phosphatase-like HAD superfamily hydrolase